MLTAVVVVAFVVVLVTAIVVALVVFVVTGRERRKFRNHTRI